jgi:uncharacterized protein (DUF1330 family)
MARTAPPYGHPVRDNLRPPRLTSGVIDAAAPRDQAGGNTTEPREIGMTAYAIANLRDVHMGPGIVEYLERIDATLAPFDGRFIVHGGQPERVEGDWAGTLVVIEFPSQGHAKGWYDSPGYRAILPLRTDNSSSDTILVEGVGPEHKATDVLG